MAHLALYRKYRPQVFSRLIGQNHIVRILRNQVAEGRPSHAYLFCGSRGAGKTSAAKILSKAVNCLEPIDGEPCQKCQACLAAASDIGDIIEIDAASNNGVDNVRDLIEQAQFRPMQLKHRVFIIDEVHMLSTQAFNALLKTLEEPPGYVVFILATTEPQKLPATIISRCQRFDFHRLSMTDIITCLRTVLKEVGATIDSEGLELIARAADGGMRDALSLADQCLSFCGNNVTAADAYAVLGSVQQDSLFSIADSLLGGDCKACLSFVNDVVRTGRDLTVFLNDLGAHLRALLLTKTCGSCEELLDCTTDRMERYIKQAKGASEQVLLYAMEQIIAAQGQLRFLPSPRTLIESTLIRICRPVDDSSLQALAARVELLESRAVSVPQNVNSAANESVSVIEKAQPAAVVSKITSGDEPPFDDDPPFIMEEPPMDYQPYISEPAPMQAEPQPKAEPTAKRTQPIVPKEEPTAPKADEACSKTDSSQAQQLWQATVAELSKANPMLRRLIMDCRAVSLEGEVLTVAFPVDKQGVYNLSRVGKNYLDVQQALQAIRPGTSLSYILDKATEEVARLQNIFGSKLRVE